MDSMIQMLYSALWVGCVVAIIMMRNARPTVRVFSTLMLRQWKKALLIMCIFWLGMAIGGTYLTAAPLIVFCQALLGFALAEKTGLPGIMWQSPGEHRHHLRQVVTILIASIIVIIPILLATIAGGIIGNIAGEHPANNVVSTYKDQPVQSLFILLAGAGIAEETVFRLVLVPLIILFTHKKWLAICGSSLLFAIYHLIPINSAYQTYWQFPVTQFAITFFTGIVFAYVYLRRGYETTVLGHTLSNWIPLLFMH